MQRGFTLAEVLTAMGLLTVAALSTAQLFAATATAIRVARMKTSAATFAAARMETLRAAPALEISPADSLERSAPDFSEWLDADGRSSTRPGAVFVSRWSIAAAAASPDLLVIQVLVRPLAEDAAGERVSRAQVRLVTVRAR